MHVPILCPSLHAKRGELVAASGYCDDMKNASKFYDTLMCVNGIKRSPVERFMRQHKAVFKGLKKARWLFVALLTVAHGTHFVRT